MVGASATTIPPLGEMLGQPRPIGTGAFGHDQTGLVLGAVADPGEGSAQPGRAGREGAVLHHRTSRPDQQGHGVSGGVGVDSNDTGVLLGDGPHGGSPLGQRDGEMSAQEVRRQTCNESRPWSDRLLIKPSERAEPASPPTIAGHINCKASADRTSTGLRSRVTQESRPQPRRHQLCQPAPGQPARALQVTQHFVPNSAQSPLLAFFTLARTHLDEAERVRRRGRCCTSLLY